MSTLLQVKNFDNDFLRSEHSTDPTQRPESVAELGIRQAVLDDIVLKTLCLTGPLSIFALADHVHLGYEATNELFSRLRAESLCMVNGMVGNFPRVALTSLGRSRALELLSQNQYTGAAPVSLERYVEQVRRQSVQNVEVHAAEVERAFAHLVIDDETLRQFGTALNSGSSIFLYGPPGVGKTTMAEVLSNVMAEDEVWIPHAIEVDGQIISVYDSAVHKAVQSLERDNHDNRWVRCHRPAVKAGGELTAEMLDLQFNPVSKFYTGPLQVKANNGVLIIDDFGRQRIQPEELLNRWIVPLDRRVDFLTLSGGKTIEVPFEMLVVFATNIDPEQLVDPSFLRRIQTKIRIGAVTEEQFAEIFRRVAIDKQVQYDPQIPGELIEYIQATLGEELRSCYPRDIVNQVCWAARYERKKPYLDMASLTQALEAYFPKKAAPTNGREPLVFLPMEKRLGYRTA